MHVCKTSHTWEDECPEIFEHLVCVWRVGLELVSSRVGRVYDVDLKKFLLVISLAFHSPFLYDTRTPHLPSDSDHLNQVQKENFTLQAKIKVSGPLRARPKVV